MNNKNYIDKIELILNTSGKYITRKEKDMILDYVNYFKTKNNVIEDKNIELVIEIERLNNIINKGIEAINVYQNEKTLSVGYEDLKRIRGILRGNEFDLKMFEEYLQELKGSDKK